MTYAETYEKMLAAKAAGQKVIIDMNDGMFRMSAEAALEAFEDIAPGEWFVWIDEGSEDAEDVIDLVEEI